ncbi:unnamed protein product [Gordionus sp. m RMFG-2023]
MIIQQESASNTAGEENWAETSKREEVEASEGKSFWNSRKKETRRKGSLRAPGMTPRHSDWDEMGECGRLQTEEADEKLMSTYLRDELGDLLDYLISDSELEFVLSKGTSLDE